MVGDFFERGWVVFPPEPVVTAWVDHALRDAKRALNDPRFSGQYQCEGTWFVGLDALNNDAAGRVGQSEALTGHGVEFVTRHCGGWHPLHRGQVSGVFPGYPKARTGESEAAFRYRLVRDAAHVDGVLGIGDPKRRFVKEPHAYIVGIPLTEADTNAAPLVVWDGSHRVMQRAFAERFGGVSSATELADVDVTETYKHARREVFDTCVRSVVTGLPGSFIVVHRLAVHGVAPWTSTARAAREGRLIAYFRPPMPGGVRAWINAE